MASSKGIVEAAGLALVVAGGLLGIYGLIISGYAPLTAAWWSFAFNVFWVGIAAIVAGVAALLVGVYGMKAPFEERKIEREITA
ncbi:MAG: hypothetical protein M1587_01205 [Thaumarchaeota archaeon]|nr:hypothetical protein [Nitrososphaerota archaeon]